MNDTTIKKGARVDMVVKDDSAVSGEHNYLLEDGARLNFIYLGLDGNGDKNETTDGYSFVLDGENCELNFYGFIIGRGSKVFNIKAGSKCLKRRSKSNFEIKSALYDNARVNFVGDMVIEKSGHDCESYLSHRTLLLSKKAKTKTIPGMEIKANDVKAGHAATIGMVDEEDLFYLNSRGLDRKAAIEIFIKGYFESLLAKIEDEKVRADVAEQLFKHL